MFALEKADAKLRRRSYRIIRRRIAWLLGCLVSEDLAAQSRPLIYSLIVHLMSRNESTDQAIRLTAARSLQKCDTWDFDLDGFLPYLGNAVEELVQLLGEVLMSDSLMRLNETLAVVIARVGTNVSLHLLSLAPRRSLELSFRYHQIAPFAPKLVEILGTLWNGAQENQPHFQTSILVTITRLTEVNGSCPVSSFSSLVSDRENTLYRHSEKRLRACTVRVLRSFNRALILHE